MNHHYWIEVVKRGSCNQLKESTGNNPSKTVDFIDEGKCHLIPTNSCWFDAQKYWELQPK